MEKEPQNLPELFSQEESLKVFLALQQQEVELKREEIALRREEMQSTALLSQQAMDNQAKLELKHTDVLVILERNKLCLWAFLALLLGGLLIGSMFFDKVDVALKLIEISGSVLMGYLVGFYRGKSKKSEKTSDVDE